MKLIAQDRSGLGVSKIGGGPDASELIREGGLVVKTLDQAHEKILAYQLRYRVFCQELGWVPPRESKLEIDEYDNHAVPFGVFDDMGRLLAYMRLIKPEVPYMLEKEFMCMVAPDHQIRKEPDTVEISRVCLAPEARTDQIAGNFGVTSLSLLLYKGVYQWCLANSIRYLYLVMEKKVFRLIRARGFNCELVGQPVVMPDGVEAVAAILDWRKFEALNGRKRPKMLAWFINAQSGPVRHRLPRPARDLRRPVSV